MICLQAVLGCPRRFRWIPVGALLLSVLAGGAVAADWNYVLRDGRKVPLVKSSSELGVVFRSHEVIDEARQRLEDAGFGDVQDIEGAPGARVKILRVRAGGTGDAMVGIADDHDVEDVQPVFRFGTADSPVIPTGKIVLKLAGNLTAVERDALWDQFGIGEVEVFRGLHDVYFARPAAGVDEVLLAEKLADDPRTLWANPDFRQARVSHQVAVSDRFFDFQWHLDNPGRISRVEDADIDALEAWSIADGAGVLFGMFDTACDVDHEDLRGNYIGTGQDIARPPFNDPRPKLPFSVEGHGTSVMGLAVAAGNSIGVRGVAFRARFTASRGLLEFVSDAAIASTYTFAMAQEVDVHINSWGPVFPNLFPTSPVIEDAIETAFNEGRDLDGEGGDDPLGMVIVFSSGNEFAEIFPGFGEATMPQVIAVGASTDEDSRADFSNYGAHLSFLAPGAGTDSFWITTTDNEDDRISPGFNVGGEFGSDFAGGKYTRWFGGTSASCPIAAGVAGLVLSVNPRLTATDVRILMEHSCDQVSPDDAQYDGITSKSFKYGYGRINAHTAVLAAQESLDNGGFTWPDVPTDVHVEGRTLRWTASTGTDEFLVVDRNNFFTFAPEDGACYSDEQRGCGSASLTALPDGVGLVFAGCDGDCSSGSEQSTEFEPPALGTKLLGIYARNEIGHYSFGAAARANAVRPPAVTLTASPLFGPSPLTVRFNGNALSEQPIDESRTLLDFDIDDQIIPSPPTRLPATHVYEVAPGEARTFTARLTMVDESGTPGSSEIRIQVFGADVEDDAVLAGAGGVRIVISRPGTIGSDVSSVQSGDSVELRIDSDTPGSVLSVVWDLGDGSPQIAGLAVTHTYINTSSTDLVLPITATVMVGTAGGTTIPATATRFITVTPGIVGPDVGEPDLPGTRPLGGGGSATPCGALGMVPLVFGMSALMWLRRRRF
jgi:subtilisin family serine protease